MTGLTRRSSGAGRPGACQRRSVAVGLAAVVAMPALAACGTGSSGTTNGAPNVSWYIGNENWLSTKGDTKGVIDACNEQAGGKFHLVQQPLPTNPDGQREQLVRRLAAQDSSIDLIGMDVTWTGEFAQAGWIRALAPGELANVGDAAKVLKGPFDSAQYDGKQYGAPLNSNTRLLWYSTDKLEATGLTAADLGGESLDKPNSTPPADRKGITWDRLLDAADKAHTKVQETGARAESLTVTFNSLLESAGGHLVKIDDKGMATVDLPQGPTEKALAIMGRYARGPAAPEGLTNAGENDNRLAFQSPGSDSTFMINWPFVWPSVKTDTKNPDLFMKYGWAPFPRVLDDQPAKPALGGYNLAVGAYSKHTDAAVAAINCLTSDPQQRTIAKVGGQPSVLRALAEDKEIKADLPMVGLLAAQLERAAPRPVTPNYNDVSLAVRQELHPTSSIPTSGPALDAKYRSLRDLIDKALKSQAVL